jgi:hypothetical protein
VSNKQSAQGLTRIIDDLLEQAQGGRRLSVAEGLDAFEGRVFGPVLALLGLLVVTPLGLIPLFPSFCALLIAVIAVQRLFGRRYPWIPRRLRERSVEESRLRSALQKARPWAQQVDRFLKPRFTGVLEGVMRRVVALVLMLLAATMPLLEIVPFAAALPALAVLLFGLALSAKDGIVGLAALAVSVATGFLVL